MQAVGLWVVGDGGEVPRFRHLGFFSKHRAVDLHLLAAVLRVSMETLTLLMLLIHDHRVS